MTIIVFLFCLWKIYKTFMLAILLTIKWTHFHKQYENMNISVWRAWCTMCCAFNVIRILLGGDSIGFIWYIEVTPSCKLICNQYIPYFNSIYYNYFSYLLFILIHTSPHQGKHVCFILLMKLITPQYDPPHSKNCTEFLHQQHPRV